MPSKCHVNVKTAIYYFLSGKDQVCSTRYFFAWDVLWGINDTITKCWLVVMYKNTREDIHLLGLEVQFYTTSSFILLSKLRTLLSWANPKNSNKYDMCYHLEKYFEWNFPVYSRNYFVPCWTGNCKSTVLFLSFNLHLNTLPFALKRCLYFV